MQTFLPSENFYYTAICLDNKRLGKQRVEAYQILRTLVGESEGWKNHPSVLMWKGYEIYLAHYIDMICLVWEEKGFKDTILDKTNSIVNTHLSTKEIIVPLWLGDEKLHSSHRAALLYKNYEHYKQFGWKEEPKLDYYWPTRKIV